MLFTELLIQKLAVLNLANWLAPLVIGLLYITLSSLLKEPARQKFNAVMIAGAGAAYLSGGFGVWEFVFATLITYCAFRGLADYRFIGAELRGCCTPVGISRTTFTATLSCLLPRPFRSAAPSVTR